MSPGRHEDSPHSKRMKAYRSFWWNCAVPDVLTEPTSSSSSVFDRAVLFENFVADRTDRHGVSSSRGTLEVGNRESKFKWGTCVCGYAQAPWVFRSGQRQGEIRLVCRSWLSKSGQDRCWATETFPMERFSELNKNMKDFYSQLQNSLLRSSRKGPSDGNHSNDGR